MEIAAPGLVNRLSCPAAAFGLVMISVALSCRPNAPDELSPSLEGGDDPFRASAAASAVPNAAAAESPRDELGPAAGGALACYERARRSISLGEGNAYMLCRGARSTAPADCYAEADRNTPLRNGELFDLCRCAGSIGPVDCYQRGRRETFLSDRRIIDLCSPVTTFGLQSNCAPGCFGPAGVP